MLNSVAIQEAQISSQANHRLGWGWAWAAITAVLLTPAAYNRFPLVFPDTSAYLAVAFNDSWPVDRAGFYGLILTPALASLRPVASLWLATAVQAGLISATLLLAVRRISPSESPLQATALLTLAAALTSLPWHASQLIPDAFSGALVLLVWLAASRDIGSQGTLLLWLASGVLALVHYTHVGILAVAAGTTIICAGFAGATLRELARRALAAMLTIFGVLIAHTTVYGVYFDRWQPSPFGGYFLFARLNEDGLVPRWMDRHCPNDAPKPLCDLRPTIPHDSQVLLWERRSPLYQRINDKAGEAESWRWVDMVSEAAVGSVKEEPLTFLLNAVSATRQQFVQYSVLDDECPHSCRDLKMFEWRPSLIAPVRSSRQLMGELPEGSIRAVTSTSATLGLLLLPLLFVLAVRRRDHIAASLLAAIGLSLIANAAMAGALSDVHDRYQSRVVWLAPLAALLVIRRRTSETVRND
jgi:hypothetical protein